MLETLSKINTAIKLETTDYKKLYREMLLIRRFEEKAGNLYKKGEIAGFCHLYIGQEALVTGVQSQLQDNDVVITTYRDHGHMLACGIGIGILQAAAQVQEMTISFVPKLFLVTLILFYFGPSLGAKFEVFVQSLFAKIILVGLS